LGGIGNLPVSGTVASFATILIYYFFFNLLNLYFYYGLFILLIIYSFKFLNNVVKNNFSSSDPREIVIDEFFGQSIPLILCKNSLILIASSFILFRFFDILKPFPINYIDSKFKNLFGIIFDDVVAGLYSFAIIYLCI
jgi:phosphatidylglycerophosphatase A